MTGNPERNYSGGRRGGGFPTKSFLPPTNATRQQHGSAIDRLMMRPGTTGGVGVEDGGGNGSGNSGGGMSSMFKYGQRRRNQGVGRGGSKSSSGGYLTHAGSINGGGRRRASTRQEGIVHGGSKRSSRLLQEKRQKRQQQQEESPYDPRAQHLRSNARARTQSRNRSTTQHGGHQNGRQRGRQHGRQNGRSSSIHEIQPSPITRIGFIEGKETTPPPPPPQLLSPKSNRGLSLSNQAAAAVAAAAESGSSFSSSKLVGGAWKSYFGVFSMGGEKRTQFSAVPQPKENQDSYGLRASLPNTSSSSSSEGLLPTFCFGVFDGHGRCGQHVSKYVAKRVPARALSGCTAEGGGGHAHGTEREVKMSCGEAFGSTQQELRSGVQFDTQNSGSTAVMCVLRGRTLILCNVGDSRCVLGTRSSGGSSSSSSSNTIRPIALTDDHKPTRTDEMKRILECGGAVEPSKYNGQFMGPDRVWMYPQRVGGLAVSRAMGDCAYLAAGVIAKPEMTTRQLVPGQDVYLVLGSDGIYDHMTNDEVMRLVHKCMGSQGKTVDQTAKILVTEARRKWRATGMGYVDDVTAIVVDLKLLDVLMAYT